MHDDSLMWKEMWEQPLTLRRIIERRGELIESLRHILPDDVVGYTLVARGSSDHAALFGRYVLEVATGKPVALAAPSIHTVYKAAVDHHGWVAIGVSQSGQTVDVARTLGELHGKGAITIAITNDGATPLTMASDVTLNLAVGEEHAVPATKTFTGEMLIFAMLAEALGTVPWTAGDLDLIPKHVDMLMGDADAARSIALRVAGHPNVYCVGRGYLFPVALETALKLKEVARIHAEGWSSADLRHGPIALAGADFPLLAFAAGPGSDDVRELAASQREKGTDVIMIGEDANAQLPIPAGLPEPLAAILASVRGQQVAFWSAQARGLDPDNPAGLTKITR